jgi:hypothetical protein
MNGTEWNRCYIRVPFLPLGLQDLERDMWQVSSVVPQPQGKGQKQERPILAGTLTFVKLSEP